MAPVNSYPVEVAYAPSSQEQCLLTVQVPAGCTIAYAIRQSGILTLYPKLELTTLQVGIFGKRSQLDTTVAQGDRIEIYRDLVVDPKTARKKRTNK